MVASFETRGPSRMGCGVEAIGFHLIRRVNLRLGAGELRGIYHWSVGVLLYRRLIGSKALEVAMSMRVRSIFAVFAIVLFVAFRSSSGQERALSVDQGQVVDTVKEIFAAAATDDLAKFHAVVGPGFYLYGAGARFDGDAIMTLIKAEHRRVGGTSGMLRSLMFM